MPETAPDLKIFSFFYTGTKRISAYVAGLLRWIYTVSSLHDLENSGSWLLHLSTLIRTFELLHYCACVFLC